MLARQLDYSPAAEELPKVIEVMYGDLTRAGVKDEDWQRVEESFNRIANANMRWPTSVMVKENMPKHHHQWQPKLPYKRTKHELELGEDQCSKLKRMLNG